MLTRYDPDRRGTGQILVSREFHDLVTDGAEAGRAYAISISPDQQPYSEGYIASFEVESGRVDRTGRNPRASAILRNTSDYAAAVEWRWDHHVLGRTVDFIEGRYS